MIPSIVTVRNKTGVLSYVLLYFFSAMTRRSFDFCSCDNCRWRYISLSLALPLDSMISVIFFLDLERICRSSRFLLDLERGFPFIGHCEPVEFFPRKHQYQEAF